MVIDAGGARMRNSPPRLLDAGGARMRRNVQVEAAKRLVDDVQVAKVPAPSVTVMVTETHDGEACDCIDKEMTLEVGQEIELTHVCHDGRVDKVVAKVTAIRAAAGTEHGRATAR